MVSDADIKAIIGQKHGDPFSVLGSKLNKNKKEVSIRAFLPNTAKAKIISTKDKKEYIMKKLHPDGFFEASCDRSEIFEYKISKTLTNGTTTEFYDSYSFPPGLTDFDLHLIQEGTHYKTYEKLGAHIKEINGIKGTYFSLWAPNASSVSVIGNFNNWDARIHMMRMLGQSGIWEIFIPEILGGNIYKYRVNTSQNLFFDKTDPYGLYAELSPQTASITYDIENYEWNDAKWLASREKRQAKTAPISIYEVHLGSWRRKENNDFFSYRELAHQLVEYVKEMNYTHIELLPVLEHPFYGSWGYQTIGHFAPTSRYGEPKDFMYFIDYCHQHEIGVILDWVPAHFPKDSHGLCLFDGTYLYEHEDPKQREHLDWDTFIYNYGRYEVKNFLISNALFWLDKYHLDGLRVDAVASMLHLNYSKPDGLWVPNKYGGNENLEAVSFVQELNEQINEKFKDTLVIAEESTTWPGVTRSTYAGGLGFDVKWNMGWMNDILKYMSTDPIYRKFNHSIFPFCLWYAFNENFVLVLSHDEVVHGKKSLINKMSGDYWQKFANLRLLYGFMYGHPGKKMLFMGGEIAQWLEWNHDQELDWGLLNYEAHRQIQLYVKDLNIFYKEYKCLHETDFDGNGFEWCDYKDSDFSVISFIRKKDSQKLLFVFNYTPIIRYNYKIGLEFASKCKEIFNSDAEVYGGSNVGNMGTATVEKSDLYGKPYTLTINLPPLGMLVFELQQEMNTNSPKKIKEISEISKEKEVIKVQEIKEVKPQKTTVEVVESVQKEEKLAQPIVKENNKTNDAKLELKPQKESSVKVTEQKNINKNDKIEEKNINKHSKKNKRKKKRK